MCLQLPLFDSLIIYLSFLACVSTVLPPQKCYQCKRKTRVHFKLKELNILSKLSISIKFFIWPVTLEEITQDYIIYQDEYLRWMVNNLNLVTFRFPFLSIYPFVSTQTLLSINVTTDTLTLLLQSTYSTCTILYSIKTRVNN